MFCPKCGNEVQEGQAFCPNCGNNLNPNVASVPNQPFEKETGTGTNDINKIKDNKRLLIPIIGGVVALIIIIVIIVSCTGSGAKGAIKDWIDAVANADAKKFLEVDDLGFNSEKHTKERFGGDKERYYEHIEDYLEEKYDDFKDDDDIDLEDDYEIEKIDDFTYEQIDRVNRFLKAHDFDLECTDGAFYKVKFKGGGRLYFTMEKIDGSWCVFGCDHKLDKTDIT